MEDWRILDASSVADANSEASSWWMPEKMSQRRRLDPLILQYLGLTDKSAPLSGAKRLRWSTKPQVNLA
ncbi:hypothetical protein MESS2_1030167 [Mesorhizobium metallidurans STM 2683]|uniref:Uncharacterized protein n=1 Tax=Mesorhizobium metallidurans STM 2683 TaxID=1297569 RepID=M5EGE4_9HYPH|nr:hypothetical protein MESS2_1030167 [Mesorhizobium metallidurans STM 2683]